MKMKKKIILIILIVLTILFGLFISGHVKKRSEKPAESPPIVNYYSSTWSPSPLGLAITSDGGKAYIPFSQEDTLLVVNLLTFTVIDSIDVSAAGRVLGSGSAVLTPDGKKLYVANGGTQNITVVNTENKRVEKVLPIDPSFLSAIVLSRDGSKAYVPSFGGRISIINVVDDSYQNVVVPDVGYSAIATSPSNPDILYIVGTRMIVPDTYTLSFIVFNVSNQTIIRSIDLPEQMTTISDFHVNKLVINSDETRAYFGSFMFGPADKGVGNFTVFNLSSFRVTASVPMKYGVADFAVNENTDKAYILGLSEVDPAPTLPISEYDLLTNKVVREILVSPSTDQRAIAIDPKNPNYLYMTEGDYNLLRKVEISSGKEIARLQFNKADIKPTTIIRGDNGEAYVVSGYTPYVYKLDMKTGQLTGSYKLPLLHGGYGFYQGKLYVGSGNEIYALNPKDGSVIKKYHLDTSFSPSFFTFFDGKMATIDFETLMTGKRLLLFDATTMSIIKSVELPAETHGEKVIVSPDGSKLYVERGPMSVADKAAVITVFDAKTLQVINTIEIPPNPPARGSTSFIEADFDEENRILYLLGHASVYKIDMDTNELIGILDLMDTYELQDFKGGRPATSALSGVVLSSSKDKLFIVSLDAHHMYTYNLAQSVWEAKITNLKGYFNCDAASSPDRQYLYIVNQESDNVTMIDLNSGEIKKIIELEK